MPEVRNWYEKPSIAVDLDNTIFRGNTDGFGEPNEPLIDWLRKLSSVGVLVVVTTSRPHGYFQDITLALDLARVPYDHIVTAAKPTSELYVDDLGLLPPIHALDALYRNRVEGIGWSGWDREQRSVPENPDQANFPAMYDDPDFRVVVAFTGGMDSLTMAMMAHKEGLPFELVYVDAGQDYAPIEFGAALSLARTLFDKDVLPTFAPILTEKWAHIIPGRNKAVLRAVADVAKTNGWWGELWFGNLGGESPIVGGDKSSRFLLTMQHLFTMEGIDLRIASPLRGLDKPDLVRMWFGWGRINALDKAKSCFDPDVMRCGKCQTCARTLLAYEAFSPGSWQHLFDPATVGVDMDEHFRKYWTAMPDYLDGKDSRYSPRRAKETHAALGRLRERGIWKVQS